MTFLRSRKRVFRMVARGIAGLGAPQQDEDRQTWTQLQRSYFLGVSRTAVAVKFFAVPMFALLDLVALALAVARGGGEWTAFLLASLLLAISCVWAFVLGRITQRQAATREQRDDLAR